MNHNFPLNRFDFSELINHIKEMEVLPVILTDVETGIEFYGTNGVSKDFLISFLTEFNLLDNLAQKDNECEYEKKRQRKWSDDYIKRSYDTINFRTPKNGRILIKSFADNQGMTMNDFLRKMVYEGMRREGFDFDPSLIFPEAVMPEEIKNDEK